MQANIQRSSTMRVRINDTHETFKFRGVNLWYNDYKGKEFDVTCSDGTYIITSGNPVESGSKWGYGINPKHAEVIG